MNTINFAENCHAIEFQIPRKGRNKEIRGVADAAGVIIEKITQTMVNLPTAEQHLLSPPLWVDSTQDVELK